MSEWWIQRETPPGSGVFVIQNTVPVQPDPEDGAVANVEGTDVYQDGYPNDFSGWGQQQSDTIQDYLWDCSKADGGVSYAATWIGVINPDPAPAMGLMAQQQKPAPKTPPTTVLLIRSAKIHGRHKPKKSKS
jgi:hypothetical protein